jgi:hypothetical protein
MAQKMPPPTRIPMPESTQEIRLVAREARKPAAIPGSVIRSGMI